MNFIIKKKEFGWEKNHASSEKKPCGIFDHYNSSLCPCVSLFIAVDCCIFFYVAYINLWQQDVGEIEIDQKYSNFPLSPARLSHHLLLISLYSTFSVHISLL